MTSGRQNIIMEILTQPHIRYTHEGINMADQIQEGMPHCYEEKTEGDSKLREGLQKVEIQDAEDLFVDGCCHRSQDGQLHAAYAVVRPDPSGTGWQTVEAGSVTPPSAQKAELVALLQALRYGAGKDVNIFTDSAYSYLVVHRDLGAWLRMSFQTWG